MNLGQRVRVHAVMEKEEYVWQRRELPHPVKGIVVAQKNRVNGDMDSDYDEWSGKSYRFYVPKSGFKAFDVAYNLRRLPMVVLPGDLEIVDDNDQEL